MRLKAVSIENFRGYKDRVTVEVGDFTAAVGRNDVGKSTILEALDAFFDKGTSKLDQLDPCVHSAGTVIEISCRFDHLPSNLTLDAQSQTTLGDEYLLGPGGDLELVRRYECKGQKPKVETFARALHPTEEGLRDLLKLKNRELKARAKELGADLAEVDVRSNAALRAAIRLAAGEMVLGETLVPLDADDGKKIWDQIELHLPTFALFQADRPSRDDDPEVADPMRVAVAAAMKDVQAELEEVKRKVQASVMDVAQRTLAKLREMAPDLANELTPSFKSEPKWDGFKLSLTGDNGIPINKRGSGVRRLILLNFFRAEAERRRHLTTGHVIYAVEEPESSQHPDSQVMLIKTLLALSADPNTQVMITTHVPAVAALVPTDDVRLVSRDQDGHPRIRSGGDDVYADVVASLGVLPDKRAKVAVYVEGPHDVAFLQHASRVHRAGDPTLLDLESDHRVAFVPTGGGNLKHWVNKQYLANAGLTEVHIYDRDDQAAPKYGTQVDLINARGTADVAFLTTKREMENYIHPQAIAAENPAVRIAPGDWDDVPALVAEQVHAASGSPTAWAALDAEKRSSKSSRAKRWLNEEAMSRATREQLIEMDPHGEIAAWLVAIRDRAT